ncbi:uncharacterized protein LOC143292113 [Babylonia areolata]|uniref:uncharacterized protein LOC143292113 n=1 Tax=Babylonia areolata TaxID=304850 RepID=UPI003FD5A7F0
MTTQYSTAQKLCLLAMVVGGVLCGVGGCAPYWLVTDVDVGGHLLSSLFNDLVSANTGLFLYCLEALGQSQCYLIPIDLFLAVRLTAALCILLGGLCGLLSLCLACCTCCDRLIAVGVLAFLAAGCGVYSAVMFSSDTEILTQTFLGVKLLSYGWAFYVFCAGVGVLGLASFVACCASPERDATTVGVVMCPPQAGPPTQLTVLTPTAPTPHAYQPQFYGPPQTGPVSVINMPGQPDP